jgi:hypothetical protein
MLTRPAALLATLFVAIALFPVVALAQPLDVRLFALLDVGGSFRVNYAFSDLENVSSSSASSSARQSTWEEELSLSAMAYVYHPGFLTIGVSGGPQLVQRDTSDETLLVSGNETLFNFAAKLDFLKLKWYPFSTFFSRSHPAATSSLSVRLITQRDEYGLEGFFFPDLPFQVRYRVSRTDRQGSDFGTVIDEVIDLAEVRLHAVYRDGDKLDMYLDQSTRASASGSAGLPIQRTVTDRSNFRINARNEFGEKRPFSLQQNLQRLVNDRGTAESETETRSYTASGQYSFIESLRASVGVNATNTLRVGADTKVRAAQATISHSLNDRFTYGMDARRQAIRQTSFDRDTTAIGGNFSYRQPTSFGSFSFGANAGSERTDQEASADTVRVFDEAVTLVGTAAVELRNEFVVPSSVVVTNTAGTQVFTEGIDYRLVIVGSVTSIQRFVDGGIFDGQTVLVDYEYQTSGTAKFDTTTAGATLSADFFGFLSAYARYNTYELDLIEGDLTTPTNDRDYVEIGVSANTKIGTWDVGGSATYSESDEEISPATREAIGINASTRIFWGLTFNISAGFTQVDLQNSPEDSDRTDVRIGFGGPIWRRANFRLDSVYTEDSGGSLPRKDLTHIFRFGWQYRAMTFEFNARYADNELGVSRRGRTEIFASLRRLF